MYMYVGLEIEAVSHCQMRITFGVITSHFGNDPPNFFGTVNHFEPIANHFSNKFAKRPFFGSHPFYRQNFPLF